MLDEELTENCFASTGIDGEDEQTYTRGDPAFEYERCAIAVKHTYIHSNTRLVILRNTLDSRWNTVFWNRNNMNSTTCQPTPAERRDHALMAESKALSSRSVTDQAFKRGSIMLMNAPKAARVSIVTSGHWKPLLTLLRCQWVLLAFVHGSHDDEAQLG